MSTLSDAAPEPRVVVLMSTYNGERYVREQLCSVLAQLPKHGRILVRDDGSQDGTVATIEALQDPRIHVSRGPNCGFGRSFLTLLAAAPPDADMVMFADQDDLWLPGKVGRAWQHLLVLQDRPALYGSVQMLVDAALRPLRRTPPWPREPSFANALTENIITGCTAAINRPALLLLQRAGVPDGVFFHDWWLYLVISAFGSVVHDDEPTLLYRQHGANVIGHGATWLDRQLGMLRYLQRNDWVGMMQRQVGAFLHHYGGTLPPVTLAWVLRHFHAAGPARWRLMFTARRWRQALIGDVALRVLLVAHKLRLWPPAARRL